MPPTKASPPPQNISGAGYKVLAQAISFVENAGAQSLDWLASLPAPPKLTPIYGITGPPGAGKSTLSASLIAYYLQQGLTIGIVAVDPSSPFHGGSLLADRVRLSEFYNHPSVYIRSLSSRGALGGLSGRALAVAQVMKMYGFDIILFETVGVGQSEAEIVALADATALVLTPESGDDMQGLKSGIMELADVLVVNKSDRPEADTFIRRMKSILPHKAGTYAQSIPIIPTVATTHVGTSELAKALFTQASIRSQNVELRAQLLARKAWNLIAQSRMEDLTLEAIKDTILSMPEEGSEMNVFKLAARWM